MTGRPSGSGVGDEREAGQAHLVFVTHPALRTRTCKLACTRLRRLEAVRRIGGLVRVVGS